ncbi:kinase-like domain-containing protein [Flagelloscypha sp. PMI_526]|nr:kinase-like domain-containing protein [Flagelloscypha sp. PMI_526]
MPAQDILDVLGSNNSALGLCAMDVFQWGIDWLPSQRDRSRCFSILRKLGKMHQSVPPSLRIPDIEVEPQPFGGGGYSDVYRGFVGGSAVCVKVFRFFMTGSHRRKVVKNFNRETLLWRQLQHPNILPFLGFNEEIFAPSYSLISPLMLNGNIRDFLEHNPHFDRVQVLIDVAEGISYLHEYNPPIIHGDIRGANILVKDNLECCLGDLGLSLIAENGQSVTTSSTARGGAVRWMAPELLDTQFSLPDPDRRKRDIYAFGCTGLEICTNEAPFSNQSIDYMVCLVVTQGRRPPRPSRDQIPDWLWSLIEMCWQEAPLDRPNIDAVLSHLKYQSPVHPDNRFIHAEDWDHEGSISRASTDPPSSDSTFECAEIIFSNDVVNMHEWSKRTELDMSSADRLNANYTRAHRWLSSFKEILMRQYEWKEASFDDPRMLFSIEKKVRQGPGLRLSLPYNATSFFSLDRRIQWEMVFHSNIFQSVRKICPPINDLLHLLQCLLPGVVTVVNEECFQDRVHRTSRGLPPHAWVTRYEEDLARIFGVQNYETLKTASADPKKACRLEVELRSL